MVIVNVTDEQFNTMSSVSSTVPGSQKWLNKHLRNERMKNKDKAFKKRRAFPRPSFTTTHYTTPDNTIIKHLNETTKIEAH